MKAALLALLMSSTLFASSDYKMVFDGKDYLEEYVGDCSLHEVYKNKFFSEEVIHPYTEGIDNDYYVQLDSLSSTLVFSTYVRALEPVLGSIEESGKMDLTYFDDLTISRVTHNRFVLLRNLERELYRVRYGVGGGNGGYLIYSVPRDRSVGFEIRVVAHTFDSEVLSCDDKFMMSGMNRLLIQPID